MEDWLRHVFLVTMRWLHIVCTTLIVGGTLFFEFVLPLAIEDLKRESQLAVFGKARWVFKQVVWVSAILLLLSGATTMMRLLDTYHQPSYHSTLPWALAHIGGGILALGIALMLTTRRRPPDHAVGWLRINLALLLLVILAAEITRHIRLTVRERDAAMIRDTVQKPLDSTPRDGAKGDD